MRRLAASLFVLVLAGCAGQGFGSGGDTGRTVMKASSGDIVPPARRYLEFGVRSFAPDSAGTWSETAGARCIASAGSYRGVLVTPGQLVMPDLGPDAPVVETTCSDGTRSGRGVSPPIFAWPADEKPDGFRRFIYGGGWWFGYQKSGPMRYDDIDVRLSEVTK